MSDFAPGVEAAKKALGSTIKIEKKPHAPGGTGVKFSLDEVAKRVREGRNDPRLRAWATRAIHDAGGAQDNVGKARAILAALKKKASYVLDPVGTEFMQQPHQTLCLDELGLCFKGGDCDDLVIAYASAMLSVGVPSMVVGQSFDNSGVPSHVIAAVLDNDNKDWLRVDPSTKKPVGEYVTATKEWWVDPMNANDKTSATIAGAGDFVGIGHIPEVRQGDTGVGRGGGGSRRGAFGSRSMVFTKERWHGGHDWPYDYEDWIDLWPTNCVDLASAEVARKMLAKAAPWLVAIEIESAPCGGSETHYLVAVARSATDEARIPSDVEGVPVTVSVRATGLGQGLGQGAPADPTIAQAAVQQVQAALYNLTTSQNNLQAALDQLAQVTAVVGYDPEPATAINGVADFPTGGVWTKSMTTVCQSLLSQTSFLLGVAEDGLNGVRDIIADPTTNQIGFASVSSDPYVWKTVLTTATDAIIGIFNPAGTLLVGITQALGAVLTPAEVQTQVSSNPTGTIQGVPEEQQGVGNPIVIAAAVGTVTVVAILAFYFAYAKWCDTATALANAAVAQKTIEFGDAQIKAGVPPQQAQANVAALLGKYQSIVSTAAQNNAKDNPFASTLDSLKWLLVAGGAIGVVVLAWPFLKELGEVGAASLHAKRLASASRKEQAA